LVKFEIVPWKAESCILFGTEGVSSCKLANIYWRRLFQFSLGNSPPFFLVVVVVVWGVGGQTILTPNQTKQVSHSTARQILNDMDFLGKNSMSPHNEMT